MSRQTVVDNIRALLDANSGAEVLIDLSADAWGHGLVESARAAAAAGLRLVAVPTVREAELLRDEDLGIETVVWSMDAVSNAAAATYPQRVASLLDLASALARGGRQLWLDLGIRPGDACLSDAELDSVVELLVRSSEVGVVLCSSSDARTGAWSDRLDAAGVAIDMVLTPSLDTTAPASPQRRAVRVGAEAFGLSEAQGAAPTLVHPALSLQAPVISTKSAAADIGVSYGYTYRTTAATTLALIPVGYGDGVDRSLGNRAEVLLGGRRYTIAGRVAMDATVLDIGAAPIRLGQLAEFFGDPRGGAPSAADYAALLGISSASLVAGLTARVERIWT